MTHQAGKTLAELGLSLPPIREQQKSLTPAAAEWFSGQDASSSGAILSNAYQQVVWVYAAINVIAQQIASIPFRFAIGDRLQENYVTSGPLAEFYSRPHPQISGFEYWELRIIWLMLRGECFRIPIYKGRKLARIAILDPRQFVHIVMGNELVGWRYTGGTMDPLASQVFLPEEVWFEKLPNPFNFWRGMAPLQVAALASATDFAAGAFMKGLMENNADTGVIITTDQQVDKEQREQLLAALRDRKRKAGTADRPLFLTNGAKLEKPQLSSADMQFLEHRRFSRSEICGAFGVPEELIAATETAKYDVMEGARLNFVENRIAPLCARLESSEAPTVKAIDARVTAFFDVDSLPIMQKARRERWASAKDGFDMGVPLNELNRVFDLGAKTLPHGNTGWLPFNLQPVGEVPPAEQPPANQPDQAKIVDVELVDPLDVGLRFLDFLATPSPAPKQIAPPHVCTPNPEYDASIAGNVRLKKSKLSRFFFEQRGRVLAAVEGMFKKSVVVRSADDAFNKSQEDSKLIAALKPLLVSDLEFGGAQLFKEIGLDNFKLSPTDAIAFLAKRESALKGINATIWNNELRPAISDGLKNGSTFDQIKDAITEIYAAYGNNGVNTERIALTETNAATNGGRHTAMVVAKVERKGWETSHLEGTRDTHLENEALSKSENGIPIDDTWPNGCMYPGDPDADAGETINCRCFGYAIIGGKAVRATRLLRYEEWFQAKECNR